MSFILRWYMASGHLLSTSAGGDNMLFQRSYIGLRQRCIELLAEIGPMAANLNGRTAADRDGPNRQSAGVKPMGIVAQRLGGLAADWHVLLRVIG
eukprot:scaffold332727_cov36-Prasinocladus_malaysianus.AAC.1